MNKELVKENIIFYNSNGRSSGSISNHTTVFDTDLFNFGSDEYAEMELTQFNTKQTYYNVSSGRNNRFTYSENSGSTTSTITLTEGNYNFGELVTELQTQLNNNATDLTWVLSANTKQLKISYQYSGTPASTVTFTPIGTLTTFRILGFNNVAKNMTATETSDNVCSIGNLTQIFLTCNQSKTNTKNDTDFDTKRNTFANIDVLTNGFFGNIIWEKISDYSPTIIFNTSGANTNSLEFSIMDKDNNFVELSDDWTATFVLKIYKKAPFSLRKLQSMMALTIMDNMEKSK